MGMEARGEHRLAAAGDPPGHSDRFPAGGRAVVHRGVGDVAAVEPGDLGLELEQGLESALGDLGLVGRVAGQELAALDEMVDRRRDVVPIGAAAEEEGHVAGDQILPRQGGQLPLHRHLAEMVGQALDLAVEAGGLGHVDEQIVDRGGADGAKHVLPVRLGEGKVTHVLTPLFGRLPHGEAQPDIIGDPASVGLLEGRPKPRLD